jgi:hypothetical protein
MPKPPRVAHAPGIKLEETIAVLTEFIEDVEAVGAAHLEESWPDIAITYRKALNALYRNPKVVP